MEHYSGLYSRENTVPPAHRRTGEHPFGGSNRVLPEWRKQLVCHAAPPGRKNNNELLQCLFLTVVDRYPRRLYPMTSPLLPQPKCISGRWILVPFGVTQLVKQMCCLLPEYVLSFARINVMYLPELGGQLPPLTPRPVRLCTRSPRCHRMPADHG